MNVNREAALGATFFIASVLAVIGFVADDLRVLLVVGGPIAIAAFALSRNRSAIILGMCAFSAIRFLITLIVTHDVRALVGLILSGSPVLIWASIARARHGRR